MGSFNFKDYVFGRAKKIVVEKGDKASIVFPESGDIRILKATIDILKEKLAGLVVLIGHEDEIFKKLKELVGSRDDILAMVRVVDLDSFKGFDRYLDEYCSLRQKRELTFKRAKEELLDEIVFSMMMVRLAEVKTCVCGVLTPSVKVLKSVFTILPKLKETKFVSSFMIMDTGSDLSRVETCFGYEGILMFSDCAVIINPDSLQLAEIAIHSANSFRNIFSAQPKVALLSFSTKGSAHSVEVEKVRCALEIVKSKCTDLFIDGELQLDAALIKSVAEKKCNDSLVAGAANILIFPSLESGNIGYKLVERLAFAKAYGPFLQGLQNPVSDLSRGCSVDDIVLTSALMISS
ncbi:phosphate acetyltransferase [Borrelia miyamotoi]|uniref:Phosphate acetyltransferase n=1 Tax=Borrelia miyamotoi TaxID=47466 RepID=A0AAX3JL71_9SPIR|nr:phosphate acetyltransferase [Borrelia miyamotoi]QFP41772.1 phosphate acetyltransferase [Borrelia miyamotoi]QFP47892.1 phosphate acetyltransferase [Borrelia miyamotoi]QGT55652.1 phosphate acetyltransferase [Borrelia miyamotoi]QGT56435.1 phosphate acetyltransferase [Borrelia miyamotoi]WAZ71681.1 phosphate acetyltransferase [Borrelia miyamotoi]